MARLHREVMQVLIAEIVSGQLETGEWLPRETDLAERYEVSRGVAREVIRGLEERGLVAVRHGRGAQVTPRARWDMFDAEVLAAHLEGPRRAEILGEYLECRRVLELEACRMAAERAQPADIDRMREALEQMRESAGRPASRAAEDLFHQSDLAFHRAIIDATGNSALAGLTTHIHAALLAARYPLARPAHRLERAIPEHERIFDAIAAGDPGKAVAAMDAHLATIAGYLAEERAGNRRASRRARKRAPVAAR